MGKIIFVILAVFSLAACSGQDKSKKESVQEEKQLTLNSEPAGAPIHLTKQQFLDKVVNYEENPEEWVYRGNKPAIVDFYATWCGPCKAISPILEELAGEYKDQIYIYKIDTDQEQELSAAFGIRSIPSLLFIPMTGNPQMTQGAMEKADLKRVIDEFLLNNKQ